jgi:hypothetical protein
MIGTYANAIMEQKRVEFNRRLSFFEEAEKKFLNSCFMTPFFDAFQQGRFFAASNFSRIIKALILLHPEPGSVRGGVASDLVFKMTKRGKVFLKIHVEKRIMNYS